MSQNPTGFVYFIQTSDRQFVKIGYTSSDPERRLGSLQTANPHPLERLGLIRGDEAMEAKIHRRFDRYRLHGEWFAISPPILAFIRQIATPWATPVNAYERWRFDVPVNRHLYPDPVGEDHDEAIDILREIARPSMPVIGKDGELTWETRTTPAQARSEAERSRRELASYAVGRPPKNSPRRWDNTLES